MTQPSSTGCPACGAEAGGNFCSGCGASLAERRCEHCGAAVVAGARYCHRCGRPVGAAVARRSDRTPWLLAALVTVALVGAIVARVQRGTPAPAVPDMANPGAGGPRGAPGGAAPDISAMSPRERFDRLFNRVVGAAERGDTTEVLRFAPMTLGAFDQLDAKDADARYHAGVVMIETGQLDEAAAQADTILRGAPDHLFGFLLRAAVADRRGDSAAAARAREGFNRRYESELATRKPEYGEHRAALEAFRISPRGSR
ncbi:MAG TPA: zinc ribbon domain-containing protein [Gemmatimonadales bacterium]|nr:zinc ribbon domain-containing protein [Gemmatimonadales bacterium]